MRYPTHTPYRNGEGGVKVGLEPINENNWLELDDLFVSEIKQKEKLYKTCLEDVYKETKDSVESQYELLNLLKSHLRTYHPTHKPSFNKKLSPLIQASLLVQEDLVLMLPRGKEYFLGAASLCAPSNWSLKKKFNHSLLHLHKNVPTYASKIGTRVNTFFKKLPNEKFNPMLNPTFPNKYYPGFNSAYYNSFERDKIDFIKIKKIKNKLTKEEFFNNFEHKFGN